jgi:hypothetical protein
MEPTKPSDPGAVAPQTADDLDNHSSALPPQLVVPARASGARAGRRRRLRQVLVAVLAMIGLLCLGSVGAAFLLYDRATKPDLGTPALVTRNYLTAFLVGRDDVRAAQYRCSDAPGLAAVTAVRKDDDDREKKYNVVITVSVDSVREISRSGNDAQVAVVLTFGTTIDGTPQQEIEHWEFTTHNDGGWRVCSGHEVT